jgi:hypothetical protein
MSITSWNADVWEQRLREGAMQGVVEGLGIVEQRAIFLITNPPKSGRIYRRRGVDHQASAPGEAPASDTGTLVNARRTELHPDDVSGRLIFSSRHALPLEHGTRNMAARPFGRRSLMETKDQIVAAIRRNVQAKLT